MVAEEKKYDTLHFEIVRKRYLGEREERNFVRIIINGQDLLERVYEVEQVYATSSDFDGIFEKKHLELMPDSLYSYGLEVIDGLNEDVMIYDCVCGKYACWPVEMNIDIDDSEVCWYAFNTPYDDGEFPDVKIGPFTFERAAYAKEIERLKCWSILDEYQTQLDEEPSSAMARVLELWDSRLNLSPHTRAVIDSLVFNYFEIGSKAGDEASRFYEAYCYYYGFGVVQDKEKGLKVVRDIVDSNHPICRIKFSIGKLAGEIIRGNEVFPKLGRKLKPSYDFYLDNDYYERFIVEKPDTGFVLTYCIDGRKWRHDSPSLKTIIERVTALTPDLYGENWIKLQKSEPFANCVFMRTRPHDDSKDVKISLDQLYITEFCFENSGYLWQYISTGLPYELTLQLSFDFLDGKLPSFKDEQIWKLEENQSIDLDW